MTDRARELILSRIRSALEGRDARVHPGPAPEASGDVRGSSAGMVVDRFQARFEASGGEVLRFPDQETARAWFQELTASTRGLVVSPLVPEGLRSGGSDSAPDQAELGVSLALAAAAECGSLVLTGREGRRLQLLPAVHLVWVRSDSIHRRLEAALDAVRDDDTGSMALHSGPSKSADIGQILVTGVHGPGRVIAAILE